MMIMSLVATTVIYQIYYASALSEQLIMIQLLIFYVLHAHELLLIMLIDGRATKN